MFEWLADLFESRESKLARARATITESEREIARALRHAQSERDDVDIDVKNARFTKNEQSLRSALRAREVLVRMEQRYLLLKERIATAKANLVSDATEANIQKANRLAGDVLVSIGRAETATERASRVAASKMAREVIRLEREDREEDGDDLFDQNDDTVDERVEQMLNEVRDDENLALLDAVSIPKGRPGARQQRAPVQ